jgi:hypothetical protein
VGRGREASHGNSRGLGGTNRYTPDSEQAIAEEVEEGGFSFV